MDKTPTPAEVFARFEELHRMSYRRTKALPLNVAPGKSMSAATLCEQGEEWRHLLDGLSDEQRVQLECYIENVKLYGAKEHKELNTLMNLYWNLYDDEFKEGRFEVFSDKDLPDLARKEFRGDKDKFPATHINWAKAGRELAKGYHKITYYGRGYYAQRINIDF